MSGGAARVLVVDDEPQFLRALATNLRGAGYEVETVGTAGEAITAAGLNSPDAVILDLVLPDGRGTDVCRELRQWSTAPIIVVSAVGDEDEKIAALGLERAPLLQLAHGLHDAERHHASTVGRAVSNAP